MRPVRRPGDPPGERFEARLVEAAIRANYDGLIKDRNHLAFTPQTDTALRRLLEFLASGRIEVRRYEKAFLHGKAYIFADEEGTIVGSSNFTAAGLTTNMELNLGRYEPTPVRQVRQWFDDLWAEAAPFDLASIYAARFEEYDPYLVYLRVLWELYGHELQEETPPGARIRLTTFQTDGLWRGKHILGEYHGVLVADGVGLGKTFIAGELMREAIEDRRQRVLLVATVTLRDGMWERFVHEHQLYVEKVSYEQLANDAQLGGEEAYLNVRANEYAMIVVDEAQAVLDACPDAQWRLIFALCRYGGLRCPSEVVGLKWEDVDWERMRFTVYAAKTEHYQGGGIRQVPIFPELYPHFRDVFEAAEPGTTFVIRRYRYPNQNLRTELGRIIRRAGLQAWPRLFQNLRSTRETELTEQYPLHVVCAWIGNSRPVAAKHYLQVTDAHFAKAAGRTPPPSAPEPQPALPTDLARNWASLPEAVRTSILKLASDAAGAPSR